MHAMLPAGGEGARHGILPWPDKILTRSRRRAGPRGDCLRTLTPKRVGLAVTSST